MTISKLLSMCLLVASNEFSKSTPSKQTEILAGAGHKPIVFVESFASLRNKKTLIERLLKGEDVAMELEFNDIALSVEERTALSLVQPVIEKIRGTKGKYEWIERTGEQEAYCKAIIKFSGYAGLSGGNVNRCGYDLSEKQAKMLWDIASAYWGGGAEPTSRNGTYGGYRKTATFHEDYIALGCQKINRYEAEYIAQYYGWEPNLEEAK